MATWEKEKQKLNDLSIVLKEVESRNGLLFDFSNSFKAKIDDTTGFLTAPVVLARVGVQEYMGYELGLNDRLMEKIGVFRPPEEVFNFDSIQSFVNLVVTDDHPSDAVTVDNVKSLQKGQVSEVKGNDKVLSGVITITDKEEIDKINKGKKEVSVGYSNELKKQSGTFDGKKYEFVQTKIRANHLAIVDAGRCGSACKLITDHSEGENAMVTIMIDGIQYQTEDAQLAQAVEKMQKMHDEEVKQLKKKADQEEEEKKKMEKEKDEAEAKKDAAEKEKMSDSAIASLVADRASLIVKGKLILGDKMPDCMDCPQEIKTAVIDHIFDDMELDGKSEDYVNAAFDMAVKKFEKTKESTKKLRDDFLKDKDGEKITRESARKGYMKDQLKLEV